jgi:hypothetical protein
VNYFGILCFCVCFTGFLFTVFVLFLLLATWLLTQHVNIEELNWIELFVVLAWMEEPNCIRPVGKQRSDPATYAYVVCSERGLESFCGLV